MPGLHPSRCSGDRGSGLIRCRGRQDRGGPACRYRDKATGYLPDTVWGVGVRARPVEPGFRTRLHPPTSLVTCSEVGPRGVGVGKGQPGFDGGVVCGRCARCGRHARREETSATTRCAVAYPKAPCPPLTRAPPTPPPCSPPTRLQMVGGAAIGRRLKLSWLAWLVISAWVTLTADATSFCHGVNATGTSLRSMIICL